MIADKRTIQRDERGPYYVRHDKNRSRKERLIESKCEICGEAMFQHVYKGEKKERYCSHPCMPVWNKNRKYSEEERRRLDLSGLRFGYAWNKGKKGISEETRRKTSLVHTGKLNEKASNWQGGKTEELERDRFRKPYKRWQRKVFSRDNFTCQGCGTKNKMLHAHHVQSFYSYPELRFDINNGITLCLNCHAKKPKSRSAA